MAELAGTLETTLMTHGGRLDEPAASAAVASWRIAAAHAIAGLPADGDKNAVTQSAADLMRRIGKAGLAEFAAPSDAPMAADDYAKHGGLGLLAAMILLPAWQWQNRPRLSAVPRWAAPAYAEFLFMPVRFVTCAGQAELHAKCHLAAMTDLAILLEANRGSSLAVAALSSFRRVETARCLALAPAMLPGIDRVHARLLAAATRLKSQSAPVLVPREGRKMRLGIVSHGIGISPTSLSLLTLVERIDAEPFDLVLFTRATGESPAAAQIANRGAERVVLPDDLDAAADVVRGAFLDVAVFVVESNALTVDPIATLAQHRLAGVQLIHRSAARPLPLSACELYLCGAEEKTLAQGSMGPRAALLPGIGPIARSELRATDTPEPWTRAEAELPEDAFVCAVLTDLWKITPEIAGAWIAALARLPQAWLLISPSIDEDGTTPADAERFRTWFAARLMAAGLDAARFRIIPTARTTFDDWKLPLAIADVLLDAPPAAEPEPCLAAIEAGVPVVTLENVATSRTRTGALLRIAGLNDYVAQDFDAYTAAVVRIAGMDQAISTELRKRLLDAAPAVMARHDSFAQSASFGGLLEIAFDGIAKSRPRFLKQRVPLANAAVDPVQVEHAVRTALKNGQGAQAAVSARALLRQDPAGIEPRKLLAMAESMAGRHQTAMALAAAVVEQQPFDASVWHEMAVIARAAGKPGDAVKALEAALHLDRTCLEAWLLLATLTKEAKMNEMARDVRDVLERLAPDDPRVMALFAATAA